MNQGKLNFTCPFAGCVRGGKTDEEIEEHILRHHDITDPVKLKVKPDVTINTNLKDKNKKFKYNEMLKELKIKKSKHIMDMEIKYFDYLKEEEQNHNYVMPLSPTYKQKINRKIFDLTFKKTT